MTGGRFSHSEALASLKPKACITIDLVILSKVLS